MSSPTTKLLLITDAYGDQVNGVVRTWTETIRTMREQGGEVQVLHPELFPTLPGKFYHDVDLVRPSKQVFTTLDSVIRDFDPDSVHIATPEGPLGMMSKAYLARKGIEHSSSFHTDIKGFLKDRPWLRWLAPTADVFTRLIHKGSQAVLAPTKSVVDELRQKGLDNVVQWTRGVNLNDFELADPETKTELRKQLGLEGKEGPIWLNVGRVSNEKNLQAFLDLDLPGTKVIVGDGPDKETLESKYEAKVQEGKIIFAGMQKGEDLKNWYRASDIFVFPSCFDTFGLVNIEALASGLPVAAYPVKGPKDIFSVSQDKQVGFLNDDLREACLSAYGALRDGLEPVDCRNFVKQHYTWENVAKVLKENLVDLKEDLEQRIKLEPRNHLDLELKFDSGVERARVMCFSDIHISTFAADLPCHDHTKQFVAQLKDINKTVKNSDEKKRKDVLVLNGDIFDLLESYVWEYHKLPTTSKKGRIKNINLVLQLFARMAEAQKPLFTELRKFLNNSEASEIVYLPGNHDHLFKIVPELREMFISLVCGDDNPEAASRIRFTDTLNLPQIKLRAEHGHRIDKYDYSENGVPNWGDYLSLVKVNLVRHIVDRLEALKTDDESRNAMLDKQ